MIITTEGAPVGRSRLTHSELARPADVEVDLTRPRQEIKGFGGALNEKGWEALSVLPEAEREVVVRALFDPTQGLRLSIARIPIGASDYALDRYTLDEHKNDFEMRHFSIERDKQRLIPFVRAVQKVKPDLVIWASAWTPPTWMKTNGAFDSGAMKDEPRVYGAYALYLAKFVEAYAEQGIQVAMVVPQNEPGQLTHYPSCDWKPQQYIRFIGEHLAPLFHTRGLKTRIFVGTINRDDSDVLTVLSHPRVSSQVSGVALQWEGRHWLGEIQRRFPNLEIMQSETECGNNHWQAQFDPEKAPNDFAYAAHTWRKFQEFIEGGSSSYLLWNLVLDEQGKNIDAQRPWPQNSPIVVDRVQKRVVYTPMFWATQHFSALIDRRSRLLESKGGYSDRGAVVSPDGKTIVQLLNAPPNPVSVAVQIAQRSFVVELPPRAFASLIVP